MRKLFLTASSVLLVAGMLSAGVSHLPADAQAGQSASAVETIAFFEPDGYAVRVFRESGQLKINLYDQRANVLTLNGAPVTQQSTPDGMAYLYQGELMARVLVASDGTQQLEIDGNPASQPTAAQAELQIDSDTAAFSDRTLQSGPIQLTVDYMPPELERTADENENLQYKISYQGQNPAATVEAATATYYFANLSLSDLDSDGLSEVVVQSYSGGAHCCTSTSVYSWQGDEFKTIEIGYLDGEGGRFEDLDGDGFSEFVSYDNRFLYRFSSYAGSSPPPLISTFKGGELTETTQQYPAIIQKRIAQIEEVFADQSFNGERNGLLAGYVAMKSLVGEYDEGWAYMLEHYNPGSDWGLEIRDDSGEEVGAYPDFPTALTAFLEETGYR